MSSLRVFDSRLHERPCIYWTYRGLQLKARILTPARFSFALHVLFYPLMVLWRCAVFVLLADVVLTFAGIWTLFAHVAFGPREAWGTVGAIWLCWNLETLLGYPATKALFGWTLALSVEAESLEVGRGLFKERYPRDNHLTFRVRQFDFAEDPVYQRSMGVDLLIDETLWVPVAEVFGWQEAARIVTNANRMIELAESADSDHDGFHA